MDGPALVTAPGEPRPTRPIRGADQLDGGRRGVKELLGRVGHYRRVVELGATRIDVNARVPARRRTLESMGG